MHQKKYETTQNKQKMHTSGWATCRRKKAEKGTIHPWKLFRFGFATARCRKTINRQGRNGNEEHTLRWRLMKTAHIDFHRKEENSLADAQVESQRWLGGGRCMASDLQTHRIRLRYNFLLYFFFLQLSSEQPDMRGRSFKSNDEKKNSFLLVYILMYNLHICPSSDGPVRISYARSCIFVVLPARQFRAVLPRVQISTKSVKRRPRQAR